MTTTVVKLKAGSVKFKGKETPTLRFALKDVWFYFLTTAPRPNKGKTTDVHYPAKNSSYSVQVLVSDKKVLKELEKNAKKGIEGYSKMATVTVDADDFEDQFKCAPPFEAEEYHFLKLSRHASYADGAVYEGSHFVPVIEIKDGKRIEHAKDVIKAKRHADHDDKKNYDALVTTPMIGNGSKGHVILTGSWYEFENEVNQRPIQEQFVITDLIEYVSSGKSTEMSDDDAAALGIDGLETVKAERKPKDAVDEIEDAYEDDDSDDADDEPMDDPDSEADFQTE